MIILYQTLMVIIVIGYFVDSVEIKNQLSIDENERKEMVEIFGWDELGLEFWFNHEGETIHIWKFCKRLWEKVSFTRLGEMVDEYAGKFANLGSRLTEIGNSLYFNTDWLPENQREKISVWDFCKRFWRIVPIDKLGDMVKSYSNNISTIAYNVGKIIKVQSTIDEVKDILDDVGKDGIKNLMKFVNTVKDIPQTNIQKVLWKIPETVNFDIPTTMNSFKIGDANSIDLLLSNINEMNTKLNKLPLKDIMKLPKDLLDFIITHSGSLDFTITSRLIDMFNGLIDCKNPIKSKYDIIPDFLSNRFVSIIFCIQEKMIPVIESFDLTGMIAGYKRRLDNYITKLKQFNDIIYPSVTTSSSFLEMKGDECTSKTDLRINVAVQTLNLFKTVIMAIIKIVLNVIDLVINLYSNVAGIVDADLETPSPFGLLPGKISAKVKWDSWAMLYKDIKNTILVIIDDFYNGFIITVDLTYKSYCLNALG